MQKIGIGESDFKGLRVRENYYIDKTMYIKDIIDNESRVILVTRPRRFGKTLNMSMLKYYFDCTQKDNKELFEGLKIMEARRKIHIKIGILSMYIYDIKRCSKYNFEKMLLCLKTELVELYIEHAEFIKK